MEEVTKIHDFVEDAVWQMSSGKDVEVSYGLMEIVEGVNLMQFFNNAIESGMKLNERYCRFIFYRIAQALHKLHVAGLAHRDIKPENIILTPEYKIKFVDFDCVSPLSGREGDSQFLRTRIGT